VALTAAKNGPAGIKNEISSLNEQLAGVQSKRVGYTPNPLADTANGFSRFLTGHTVVEGGTTYTQEEKDRQINSLQQRISADQQKLAQPANDVAEAQRRYDEFVAKVPW
jgi:peptidoglycan hydrolase CwlO-like protein